MVLLLSMVQILKVHTLYILSGVVVAADGINSVDSEVTSLC